MNPRGTLFGVSVGPGDPELLTLKAVRALTGCPVIAAPRTAKERTVALDIIQSVIDVDSKQIVWLDFTMSHDASTREEAHQHAADLLREPLSLGMDVAMLSLGDVSVYSSFQYMAELLMADYPIEMIPGVPSFCAAASRLTMSLTTMNSPLTIIPARGEPSNKGTRVYMKSGSQLQGLLSDLDRAGELDKAHLVQDCGMPTERCLSGREALTARDSYFSIVIVKA